MEKRAGLFGPSKLGYYFSGYLIFYYDDKSELETDEFELFFPYR